ncbi:longicornsin-like [Amblyomma americanum]
MCSRVTLRLLLAVAVFLAVAARVESLQRARRDFGCAQGMIFMCQRRCMRLYPGSTGYCRGFRCMCDTHIPVRPPPFIPG